jgi:hypothetical protein
MASSFVGRVFLLVASSLTVGCVGPQQLAGRALDRSVSDGELAVLAAAYNQGELGSGSCPWLHPVTGSPTFIPCEFVPLPVLASMANNVANKQAQLELGKRFEEGRGVAQDTAMARKLYRMAARDTVRGRPILVPGRDLSPLAFGEEGHGGTVVEAGLSRPRVPGWVPARGLPEASERLKDLGN